MVRYGDLDDPSLNIQNITTDYVFSLRDEDKILHFKHERRSKSSFTDPQAWNEVYAIFRS